MITVNIRHTQGCRKDPIRPVTVAPEPRRRRGAEIERLRRREDRDAEGAEGVRFEKEIFRFLLSKKLILVHPVCFFLQLINLN